jgi:stage II sporulation protein D
VSASSLWLKIGQSFGWDKVPGSWMSMKVVGGNMELKSRGAGHGVGLCQWGAAGMAKQGFSYRDILRHYYPKAMLQRG